MASSTTTKNLKKTPPKFDVNRFEQLLEDGDAGLAFVNHSLRTAIDTEPVPNVLNHLLEDDRKANLFEYTLSVVDDSLAFILRDELTASLEFKRYSSTLPAVSALERLAKFLCFISTDANFVTDFHFVQSSQEILLYFKNANTRGLVTSLQGGDEVEASPKISKKKRSQRQAKNNKQSLKINAKIENLLCTLNEMVPCTESEIDELSTVLLVQQKGLLERFIETLRDPLYSDTIRELYLTTNIQENVLTVEESADVEHERLSPRRICPSDSKPAYPSVQPLKASLFFDSAEGLGEWRIFMSTTAIADLRGYRKDQTTFEVILKKLWELSNGFFSHDNQKRLTGPDGGIPIFEAKATRDLRLIYQIDCVSDFECQCESQAIRLYGVFTHAKMDDRMWKSLSAQLTRRGKEYHRRIAIRKKLNASDKDTFSPMSWADACDLAGHIQDGSFNLPASVLDENLQSVHQWLVLEKYSAFSQTLLNIITEEKESSPVFTVSPYERAIIEHPSACYVIGRSGTGKTTTMTFKMFGIERTVQKNTVELSARPRQLFVTQSHVLASRVREYYTKLSSFLSASAESCHQLADDTAQTEPYDELEDSDDEEERHRNLPNRFSELREDHFPLFLTFDKLCKLIEADFDLSFTRPSYTEEHRLAEKRFKLTNVTTGLDLSDLDMDYPSGMSHATADSTSRANTRSSLVTFETFCNDYWKHFPQNLTNGLDPALVFSEFLGVIEGSEESLRSSKRFLSQEEYVNLSERTRPTFASQRERIYLMFEKYVERKRDYADYDAADRSHAIIRCMERGYDSYVDYLYVDEAQDNLIIDAILLRRLCRNPHGMFCAGDTAQTIAVGSSFRFNDLKATLHNFERELFPSAPEKIIVKPASFQLTTNYRSHGGIVSCAEVIIGLIKHFWPHSIDDLQKERSMVDGPKPIFLTGWNDETASYEQFLLGEKGQSIEFGAQQCILVRNDHARQELRDELGDIGVILTLYESKGLEFDDVLLYNFFKDSPSDMNQWWIVFDYLNVVDGSMRAAPRFDEVRHAGICTELKFLYVAVTRARKNLWIMDQSNKGEAMKTLLLEQNTITVCNPDNAPKIGVGSTPEEWAETGKRLFHSKRYPQAVRCYERAGRPVERSIAEAYDLRHRARNVPRSKSVQLRNDAFQKAGWAFVRCAELSLSSAKKKYYRLAAKYFEGAHDDRQAALSYRNAEEYSSAAKLYMRVNMFDDALEIVQTKNVDSNIVVSVIGASRLHYVHAEKIGQVMLYIGMSFALIFVSSKALKLFDSEEDCLEYMEDCGFDDARASLLQKTGRIHEAAEILSRGGRSREAIPMLLADSQNPKSVRLAADYLIKCLWDQYSFGVDVNQNDASAMDLLSLGQELTKTLVDPEVTEELDMFDVISRGNKHALLGAYKKRLITGNNRPAIVLIIDHLLRGSDRRLEDTQSVVNFLQASRTYAVNLREIWRDSNLITEPGIQKLFAFQQISKEEFSLTNGSLLATRALKSQVASLQTIASSTIISLHDLLSLLKLSISTRLWSMVHIQLDLVRNVRTKVFGDPCLPHTLERRCGQGDCFRQHIDIRSADLSWFNVRVRMHLLEILFLHTADFASPDSETRVKFQAEWLTYFVNDLNPSILALGSMASISRNMIPEFDKGMEVVAQWIESRAFHFNPNQLDWKHILNSTMEIAILGSYHDMSKARAQVLRSLSNRGIRPAIQRILDRFRISDLVRSLDFSDMNFINSGTLFIQNVLEYRLSIDIGYLCRLVEILSASCIILHANRSYKGFRDRLLPKSWLSFLLPRLNLAQNYNVWDPMQSLLEVMANLALRLRSTSIQDFSFLRGTSANIVRNLSIQRICRAMCLVGYNTNRELRDVVVQTIMSIRNAGIGQLPSLLMPYLGCRSWAGLRRAAETSVLSSALDELVQLVQDGYTPTPLITNARISRVVFKNKEELSAIFASADRMESSKMSATAAVFVPGLVVSHGTSGNGQNEAASDDSTVMDEGEEAAEGDDGQDEQEDSFSHTDASVTIEIPSPEKEAARIIMRCLNSLRVKRRVHAARVIQRSYEAWNAYRHEMEKPGVRGKWMKFRDEWSDNDLWQQCDSSHRRLAYLGIIPHLLVCLDALQDQNRAEKEKAKRNLRRKSTEGNVDYDEVSLRLTQANKYLKRIDPLKKQLDANSEWHLKRSPEDLKEVVVQISDLLKDSKTAGVQDDIALAIKAVVQERRVRHQTAAKPKKPSLNVEDWDEMC